jgi:hypothetical protein
LENDRHNELAGIRCDCKLNFVRVVIENRGRDIDGLGRNAEDRASWGVSVEGELDERGFRETGKVEILEEVLALAIREKPGGLAGQLRDAGGEKEGGWN